MQARPTSSLPPAQCVGAAEAELQLPAGTQKEQLFPLGGCSLLQGPLLYPGGQGAELSGNAHSLLISWTLLQLCLALFYTGPAPVRMILKSECGLLSSDQNSPKARQKERQKWAVCTSPHQLQTAKGDLGVISHLYRHWQEPSSQQIPLTPQ